MMLERLQKVRLTEEEYEKYIRFTHDHLLKTAPDDKI
jgi:hypothetical protein